MKRILPLFVSCLGRLHNSLTMAGVLDDVSRAGVADAAHSPHHSRHSSVMSSWPEPTPAVAATRMISSHRPSRWSVSIRL